MYIFKWLISRGIALRNTESLLEMQRAVVYGTVSHEIYHPKLSKFSFCVALCIVVTGEGPLAKMIMF